MPLITCFHNTYEYNPLVTNTLVANYTAIKSTNIDFEYILYNDKGDKKVEELIPNWIREDNKFKYIYSNINYGYGVTPGGRQVALKYSNGKYLHNFDQDDMFTPLYYRVIIDNLETYSGIHFMYSNCFVVNENYQPIKIPFPPDFNIPEKNDDIFRWVFGIYKDNNFTRANNFVYAPGVILKTELYNKIGAPDNKLFGGSSDFEYWIRILYYGYKVLFVNNPLWFYMRTEQSVSSRKINGMTEPERALMYNDRIRDKYEKLWKENGNKTKEKF